MRLHVIIPARDHESVLSTLLKGLPEAEKTMVVDYGSSDNTDALAKILGAHVMYSRVEDPGSACQKALRYSNYYEPDALLFASPEQDPGLIPSMIAALEDHDLVVAKNGVHDSFLGKLSGSLRSFFLKLRYGTEVGSLAPFVLVNLKSLHPLHVSQGGSWNRLLVEGALKNGFRVKAL